MSEAAIIAIIEFATKFGIDAAIGLLKAQQTNSIDQAIAALEIAKAKTAESYLQDAKG